MRSLAVLSLFPPTPGGIADYSADLAAELARRFRLTAYSPGGARPGTPAGFDVRDAADWSGREALTLAQVGNSAALSFVVPMLRQADVITLHDACQHDLLFPMFENRPLSLLWEAWRGMNGEARRSIWASVARSGLRGPLQTLSGRPDKRTLFPFTPLVLRHARMVVVHSRELADLVRELRPAARVEVLPHGVWPVPPLDRGLARRRLGERLGRDVSRTLLLASFGGIQAHKRHSAVLEALAASVREQQDVVYLIVGPRDPDYDLDADAARLGVEARLVVVDDHPPQQQVNELLAGADLFFNLRHPTLGSTSGALLKGLALGLPAVVTQTGPFRELVEAGVVLGVPVPGPSETAACLALIREALASADRLREIGDAARRFVERECAWPSVAARYAEILEGA